MGSVKDCIAALETLAAHEASIGEFYSVCAAQFEQHSEFWSGISKAEERHAAILREAISSLKDVIAPPFDASYLNVALVESSTKFVRRETERMKSKAGMSLAEAISTALKIECSFFDHDVFEVFSGAPVEGLRTASVTLAAETADHAEALKKLLVSMSQAPPEDIAPKAEAEKPVESVAAGKAPKLALKGSSGAGEKG